MLETTTAHLVGVDLKQGVRISGTYLGKAHGEKAGDQGVVLFFVGEAPRQFE